jgi:hypothetical protein
LHIKYVKPQQTSTEVVDQILHTLFGIYKKSTTNNLFPPISSSLPNHNSNYIPPENKPKIMATVSTKTATPVMPPSFSMSQDISRAIMTASTQKAEKTRSVLIDGMPPAPPPSPVAFKAKGSYDDIPSLNLE